MEPVLEGYRLSPQQRRLWQLQQDRPLWAQVAVRIEGELERELLAKAVDELVARHEILRTAFRRPAGVPMPVQVILEAAPPRIEEVDFRGLGETEQRERVADLLAGQRLREVDLESPPLLSLCLARLDERRHALLVSLPSLTADARTLANLVRQLAAVYGGETPEDAPEVTQYLQFSEWQLQLLEEREPGSDLAAWRREPEDPGDTGDTGDMAALPFERRSAGRLDSPMACPLELSPALARAAADLAASRGIAFQTVFLAAWQLLLARYRGSGGCVVAVPFDGRKYSELHDSCGPFAKWLPVRLSAAPEERFTDLLARLQGDLEEAESWQEYFEAPDAPEGAVSGAGFLFAEGPAAAVGGGLTWSAEEPWVEGEPLRLTLSCRSQEGRLALALLYDPEAFAAEGVGYLAARYGALLADALTHPAKTVAELDLLGEAEERRLLGEVGRGEAGRRWEEPVHLVIARQAAATPEAPAVVCGGRTLTYAELDRQANQLAHRLLGLGIGPGSLVPVWLPRSPEMVVALLGVLKAGAAYVPLDPAQPSARLARMLAALDPQRIITTDSLAEAAGGGERFLRLDLETERLSAERPLAPEVAVPLDALAYVLYTSGSTGEPKGVMVSHRGLANYLGWAVEAYGAAARVGAVVHSPIGFDLTVTALFTPLCSGGRAVLLPEEAGLEGLAAALAAAEVALFKLTPSHLDAVAELLRGAEIRDRPRLLVVGGEALTSRSVAAWWERDPRSRIVDEYGPTETVVGCTVHPLEPGTAEEGPVPIGRPIANTRVYVLDRSLRPVAAGVRGELHVGGPGLARGYLGLPDRTAERFLPDPCSGEPGARLYATGDVVRWRLSGELEFLGRRDAQVKVRGHRVEPAEVERALARHPALGGAVVLAHEEAGQGCRLVAYLAGSQGSDPAMPADGELRAFLEREVPEFMIPAAFVPLAAFPLTPNGKVDTAALRSRSAGRAAPRAAYVAPESELERTLAAIWTDVLRVERVSLYDNFFDLGGHSILMVQVFSRIKAQLATDLLMVELFEFPTIHSMAKRLAQERERTAAPALGAGQAEARLEALRQAEADDPAAARRDARRSLDHV